MSDLRLWELSKRYGRGPFVIEGYTASVAPGEGVGLVGPNGSGKTTLLRLLSVTAFPTEGQVLLGDIDAHAEPHRYLARLGIVHDTPELPQYLSAVELLEYVARARQTWDAGTPNRIARLLDRLLLDERRENLIGTYSSGMLAKTQIAAALLPEPAVLLMDEPFRGLDEASTDATVALLQEYRAGGGILVVASHLRLTLEAVCDRYIPFPLRTPT